MSNLKVDQIVVEPGVSPRARIGVIRATGHSDIDVSDLLLSREFATDWKLERWSWRKYRMRVGYIETRADLLSHILDSPVSRQLVMDNARDYSHALPMLDAVPIAVS